MTSDRRPRICVFAGPSLPTADIRSAFATVDVDLEVLPPVQQGDVLRLLDRLPDVLGIVDGYFFHAPSVLHRELLLALERGARVLGASSIGALRAAELDGFGMEGVGAIYHLYRRGAIDGDDEVAVLHGPQDDGFRALTEALVNIRHNLRRARRRRLISGETAATALACAKRLPFMQRTYPEILGAASPRERSALDRFLRREAVDLKHQDALLLARTIVGRIDGSQPWPPRVPLEVRQTSLLHRYQRRYVGQRVAGRHIADDLVLAFQRLLAPSFLALYRRVALRCLALDEAAHRGLASDSSRELHAFRRSRRIQSDRAYDAWLRRRLMSPEELLQLLRERDLEDQVLDRYRARRPTVRGRVALLRRMAHDVAARHGVEAPVLTRPLLMHPGVPWTGPLIRELKGRGAFVPAVELAGRILGHNSTFFARYPRFTREPVRQGLLDEFVARRWGVDPAQLPGRIRERGFTDHDEFVEAARHAYIYERARRARTARDWDSIGDCFVHL